MAVQDVTFFDPAPPAATSVALLEEAFRRGDRYFRDLLEALPTAIYVTDADGRVIFFNEACIAFSGRTPVLGSDYWCVTWRLLNPDGTPLPHDHCPMAVALKEDRAVRGAEAIAERPDGTRVPFIPYPTPLHDADGRLIGAVNMLVDITERKKAEEALRRLNEMLEQRIEARTDQMTEAYERLRQSERRFRLLVNSVVDYAIFMLDENGYVTNWNAGAERIKGYSSDEIVGQHFSIFYTPEDRAAGVPQRVLKAARRDGRYEAESWRVRKSGERFWANVVIDAVRGDRGEIVGYAKVTRDFTERRKAEQALIESERMARGIINTALDAFVQWDQRGSVSEWNSQAEAIFGWSREDAVGRQVAELLFPEDGRAAFQAEFDRFVAGGRTAFLGHRLQMEMVRRDGVRLTVELAATVLPRADGYAFNGFIRDLTDKIVAEAAQRQALKMEAVGQLTGGIAHDFNNLLAAIIPSLELAKQKLGDNPTSKYLESALRAAERGASLTRQLLSFARKQELAIERVDVNKQIASICEMLPRTLGPTAKIETRLAADTGSTLTDPNQLELAILNLAINARDAMPGGGVLTISTGVLGAETAHERWQLIGGDYITIAVGDTGSGMTEEVRSRVFEPFYTTKDIGKGSGLGLSMVYGFVQQSGGSIAIESEPGQGTTVRLFLPRA
ncbi:MAG TPA: PAS domain S-box protein [Stellaceae bacterium]|nr:PAS domain S-box protein [Stellaceae bacterium]